MYLFINRIYLINHLIKKKRKDNTVFYRDTISNIKITYNQS